ncbi:hypothetical protein TNCV_3047831 [Trichonephila clavipes]|nr:hypothetical protein TNCV_3047831 [Trichonephila clavipes]
MIEKRDRMIQFHITTHNSNWYWAKRDYHSTFCHTDSRNVAQSYALEFNDRRIRRLNIRNPFSPTRNIQSRLSHGKEGYVSTQTIGNKLFGIQLRAWVKAAGVPLNAQHRVRHLAWCHSLRTLIIDWHRILFTNESHFCLWRNDGRQ